MAKGKSPPLNGGNDASAGVDDSTGSGTSGDENPLDGIGIVVPPTVATGNSDSDSGNGEAGEPKRKRGRPAGSGGGKTTSKAKISESSITGIEKLLYAIHAGVASAIKTPELALDPSEAKLLAGAVADVAQHYDMGVISPKTMAWVGLVSVAGSIYGPRLAAVKMRKDFEKKPQAQTTQSKMDIYSDPQAGISSVTH